VLAVGILAGLGAAVLVSEGGSGRQPPGLVPSLNAASSPRESQSLIGSAAQTVCMSDYAAVSAAAAAYETLYGKPPANLAMLSTILKDPVGLKKPVDPKNPVGSTGFSITINPDTPGQVEVSAGGHPPQPGDDACRYAG
jgi:hypothetical protein